jgi:hypothetical protein
MKNYTLLLMACIVVSSGCKKSETSSTTVTTPVNKPLTSFTKKYSNGDTYTSTFDYYTNGMLKRWNMNALESGGPYSKYIDVNRNAEGVITSFSGQDITTSLQYDPISKRYLFGVETLTGYSTLDSISYVYTGNYITERTNYTRQISSTVYHPSYRSVFSYDDMGNILTVTRFTYISDNWVMDSKSTFTYDAKINPLALYNENIILSLEREFPSGKNNRISESVEYPSSTSNNYLETAVYTYNEMDKPTGAVITNHKDNFTRQLTFGY